MAQLQSAEVFTDVSPGNLVTSTRMNNMINGGLLVNGAVLDQLEKVITIPGDFVLLGDSTLPDTGVPKKVQVQNLAPEVVRNGSQQYATTDTGSANAYAIALTPAATAYNAGMDVTFKAANANTGASTLIVNGISAVTIKNESGGDLIAGDILAGQVVELAHDGTNFRLKNPSRAGAGNAQFGAAAGSANAYTAAITPAPAAYYAGLVVRFKATATNTTTSTLTVNALAAVTIKKPWGANLLPNDILAGQIVEVVHDGTNFQLVNARNTWDFINTPAALPGSNTVLAVAHGLGVVPSRVRVTLINVTGELGYSTNDEVAAEGVTTAVGGPSVFVLVADATNITIVQDTVANPFIMRKSAPTGHTAITAANWKLKVYASI